MTISSKSGELDKKVVLRYIYRMEWTLKKCTAFRTCTNLKSGDLVN